MTQQVQVYASINASEAEAANVGSATASQSVALSFLLASGTGNGKADITFSDKRAILAAANDDLDLAGVLSDIFGKTINAAKVKAIIITADAGNTADLVVSGTPSKAFSGPLGSTINVRPGGVVLFADQNAGWAVTPSTGDTLRITSAAAANYSILVVAASA